MAEGRKEASTTPVVPTVAGLAAAGMMAVGFGAGYGARAWNNSEAKRELIEKFPEQPTLEAEALARRGGFRAFAAGTALAGCMGVGAIFVARSYGITSMQQFGTPHRTPTPESQASRARPQPTRHSAPVPIGRPATHAREPRLGQAMRSRDGSPPRRRYRERCSPRWTPSPTPQ